MSGEGKTLTVVYNNVVPGTTQAYSLLQHPDVVSAAWINALYRRWPRPIPVGTASAMPGTPAFTMAVFNADDVPVGTRLYTQQDPVALEDGEYVLVNKRHLRTIMVNAKIAGDQLMGFSKSDVGRTAWCGYLDDALTHIDIAHKEVQQIMDQQGEPNE